MTTSLLNYSLSACQSRTIQYLDWHQIDYLTCSSVMLYSVCITVSYHSMPLLDCKSISWLPLCYTMVYLLVILIPFNASAELQVNFLTTPSVVLYYVCLSFAYRSIPLLNCKSNSQLPLCHTMPCLIAGLLSFNACKSAWLPDYTFLSCLDYMLCFILIIFWVHSGLRF